MNAMAASPLGGNHVVVTGDSQGCLNLHLVDLSSPSTPSVTLLLPPASFPTTTSRPILSLSLLPLPDADAFLLASGNTAGEVSLFSLALSPPSYPDAPAASLLHTYKAHQQGTNDIAMAATRVGTVSIVSGGDDQALTLFSYPLPAPAPASLPPPVTIPNASSSALKSVSLVNSLVYAVG
jgi:hypothetical protein